MPELPEVETVRRGLDASVAGRRIASVEVTGQRTVRRTSASEVIDGLTDATIDGFTRRGKYLLGSFARHRATGYGDQQAGGAGGGDGAGQRRGWSGGDGRVMIHLRMSGQLLVAAAGASPPPHTHVRLRFADADPAEAGLGPAHRLEGVAAELWFVDPRTFGEVVVYHADDEATMLPELTRLGIDPIAEPFDAAQLAALLEGRRRQLKAVLVDQHVIAGIGNIYADEILHRARLHPARLASSLDGPAVRRLHHAIVDVLEAAIEARGSTLADAQYVDLMGAPGTYQHDHAVYGRAGQRCTTCDRGIIRRSTNGGRSGHWCPVCQRTRAR